MLCSYVVQQSDLSLARSGFARGGIAFARLARKAGGTLLWFCMEAITVRLSSAWGRLSVRRWCSFCLFLGRGLSFSSLLLALVDAPVLPSLVHASWPHVLTRRLSQKLRDKAHRPTIVLSATSLPPLSVANLSRYPIPSPAADPH